MSPRPILKAFASEAIPASTQYQPPLSGALPFATYPHGMQTPHVHFPPTPGLASHHTTHSPAQYDRAPIVIEPNACALPERGGRVCSPPSKKRRTAPAKGSYFHPRAYEAIEPESPSSPPPLILDTSASSSSSSSSESTDESDACMSPPVASPKEERRLSFLPHAPWAEMDQDIRPSPTKRKHTRRPTGPIRRTSSARVPFSSFAESSEDDDAACLGGF
ncbi:hypothetical protein GGG16DRAFT_52113 [Schizophyllum commune]|nr:hypothetical protein K525DRAFT_211843 [Schizophyllum commune Loenen D]